MTELEEGAVVEVSADNAADWMDEPQYYVYAGKLGFISLVHYFSDNEAMIAVDLEADYREIERLSEIDDSFWPQNGIRPEYYAKAQELSLDVPNEIGGPDTDGSRGADS